MIRFDNKTNPNIFRTPSLTIPYKLQLTVNQVDGLEIVIEEYNSANIKIAERNIAVTENYGVFIYPIETINSQTKYLNCFVTYENIVLTEILRINVVEICDSNIIYEYLNYNTSTFEQILFRYKNIENKIEEVNTFLPLPTSPCDYNFDVLYKESYEEYRVSDFFRREELREIQSMVNSLNVKQVFPTLKKVVIENRSLTVEEEKNYGYEVQLTVRYPFNII